MKTLTITEAKKNLGKWLTLAGKGEDVGIINGAKIIALRAVEIQVKEWWDDLPVDTAYLRTECGVTPEQAQKRFTRLHKEIEMERRSGKLIPVPNNLEDALEKIAGFSPARAKTTALAARQRRGGRNPGAA